MSGSVDATVITSPAEYAAEKQGLRVIMSAEELGQLVRIPFRISISPSRRRSRSFLKRLNFSALNGSYSRPIIHMMTPVVA